MANNADLAFDEEEISEFLVEPEDRADEEEVSMQEEPTNQKRGYRIPEQWTRVINVDTHDHTVDPIHVLSTDLLMAPNLPVNYTRRRRRNGGPSSFPRNSSRSMRRSPQPATNSSRGS